MSTLYKTERRAFSVSKALKLQLYFLFAKKCENRAILTLIYEFALLMRICTLY